MATRMRWLGHSCLLFESDGINVLIDPFLNSNPKAAVKSDAVPAEFILVSHGHSDHIGDTIAIAKRTGATVIANYEIAGWLQKDSKKFTACSTADRSCSHSAPSSSHWHCTARNCPMAPAAAIRAGFI